MGTGALLRVAFAATVLAALLHAQVRAPFTGTLRDEGGKLLADAEVTCVFVPDSSASGAPDRATGRTDAEGRFRIELVPGLGYTVWAIGPAGEGGMRSIARPNPDAAGGRTLDLIADERRGPVKLSITGAAEWVADGPLSLRIFVAGRCVLGTDLRIPGDGIVTLPPLPDAQVAIALLDGKGQPIQVRKCDLEVAAAVVFVEPMEVSVVTRDDAGKALGGVPVLQLVPLPGAGIDRVGDQFATGFTAMRPVAVTGPGGTAVGRVAGDAKWLCARLPGHADAWSGWMHGARFHGEVLATNEGPLVFVLRPAGKRKLELVELPKDERVDVWFRGAISFRTRNIPGQMLYFLRGTTGAEHFEAEGARDGTHVDAKAQFATAAGVPRRMIDVSQGLAASLPEIDVRRFRLLDLTVMAGDRPVPCARVGVADGVSGARGGWLERFVTDAEGRARLAVSDQFDWIVYANTGKADGAKVVTKSCPSGPLVVQLQPLSTMRLRIVDVERRPVRGASLRHVGGDVVGRSADAESQALLMIGGTITGPSLSFLRSNAGGEIEVSFPGRLGGGITFQAVAGKRESAEVMLRADDQVQEIVIR